MMMRLSYIGMDFQENSEGMNVRVSGELQFYDSQKFMKIIPEEVKGHGRNVTFDLTELKFIDSAGLGAVLYVSEALRMQGQKLIIANANKHCHNLLNKLAPVGTFRLEEVQASNP